MEYILHVSSQSNTLTFHHYPGIQNWKILKLSLSNLIYYNNIRKNYSFEINFVETSTFCDVKNRNYKLQRNDINFKRQERKLKFFFLFKEKTKILPFCNSIDNFFVHLHQWLMSRYDIKNLFLLAHRRFILILKLIQQSIILTSKINPDISYKENKF